MYKIVEHVDFHSSFQNAFFYNGKQEMLYDDSNCFQEMTVNSINDLLPFSTTDIEYSYRGQACSEWSLQTTFERFLEGRKILVGKPEIEDKILQKYKAEFSTFSHELGYDPNSQKTLDALADIQHYGGPTRLLDFTSSFNIALFFATFNNVRTDSAVYCLRNLMFNVASADIRELLKGQPFAPGVEESLPPSKDKNKLLFLHTPERKNQRLKNQKGYFIYPGSVENLFEESLSYTFRNIPITFKRQTTPNTHEILLRSTLIKVIIPKALSVQVQRYLKKSGISASILFPDHYGAIQSLYEIETDRI